MISKILICFLFFFHLGFSQFNVFFLDAKFSPNGSFFVASNDEGQFMLCGTESKDFYKDAKKEQYFQTDYRGIRYLTSGVALDELTQVIKTLNLIYILD